MKNKKISFGLILFFSIIFGFILNFNISSNSGLVQARQVSATKKRYLIPSGEAVGVKMFTDGLLVVYVSDVVDAKGNRFTPAKDAGIRETDRILSVDGLNLKTNEELSDYINVVKREVTLKVSRDEEVF